MRSPFARTNAPSLMVRGQVAGGPSAQVDYAVSDLLPSLSLDAALGWADPPWNFAGGFRPAVGL